MNRDASDAELAAKAEEGIAQLRRYADDPFVPDLAKDTTLHLIRTIDEVKCERA